MKLGEGKVIERIVWIKNVIKKTALNSDNRFIAALNIKHYRLYWLSKLLCGCETTCIKYIFLLKRIWTKKKSQMHPIKIIENVY